MKKLFLLFVFFIGSFAYAQKEKSITDLMIECYEEYFASDKSSEIIVCPPEPADFYQFFKTTFIDFGSLREGENVKEFSFSDKLYSPLKRRLEVTSVYGMRNGRKHFGVDFRVNIGDTVCSIFCGKVRVAKYDEAYGYVVVVRHYNMSETVYAHLDKILVVIDQEVKAGQIVGLGGNTGRSTGPHLHFELRYKGFPINPIADRKFLKRILVYF